MWHSNVRSLSFNLRLIHLFIYFKAGSDFRRWTCHIKRPSSKSLRPRGRVYYNHQETLWHLPTHRAQTESKGLTEALPFTAQSARTSLFIREFTWTTQVFFSSSETGKDNINATNQAVVCLSETPQVSVFTQCAPQQIQNVVWRELKQIPAVAFSHLLVGDPSSSSSGS